jgi:hypothetical protein
LFEATSVLSSCVNDLIMLLHHDAEGVAAKSPRKPATGAQHHDITWGCDDHDPVWFPGGVVSGGNGSIDSKTASDAQHHDATRVDTETGLGPPLASRARALVNPSSIDEVVNTNTSVGGCSADRQSSTEGDGYSSQAPAANGCDPDDNDPDTADARAVFAHWIQATGRQEGRYKFRHYREIVMTRLKWFAVAELKTIIDNIAASDFHQGNNDRSQRYDGWRDKPFRTQADMADWLERAPKRRRAVKDRVREALSNGD